MKKVTGKLIASALIISFLVIPANLSAKERRGANLIVTRLDGSQLSGELIAVKPDSLLLLSNVGRDESIDLAGIKTVRIVRKSRAGLFAGIGGAAGAAVGATVGAYVFNGGSDDEPSSLRNGLVFGALGALAGWLADSMVNSDSHFTVAGKPPDAVAGFWDKLKAYSRMGRLPEARLLAAPAKAEGSAPERWMRFRLSVAGSSSSPLQHLRQREGSFRFPNENPPESGPYPLAIVALAGPTDGWLPSWGPISLAYAWNERWSAEVEAFSAPGTWGSMDAELAFTSGVDGRAYAAPYGESHRVKYTGLVAGVTYRPLSPSALRRHVVEIGAAAGPAFVSVSRVYPDVPARKTAFCGRIQAAYDFYFVPAVSVGAAAGYRFMKTSVSEEPVSYDIVFEESIPPYAATLQRPTEITLPDLSVDGGGPFIALRIGFRF
jgi:hypothetical protein